MTKYKITVTLQSPVCIGLRRGIGNVIETLDYIPGRTIRGALAQCYLRANSGNKGNFDRVFNSDSTRFGNCYPDGGRVIPFTASSCKYHSGFYTGTTEKDKHGVFDNLIPVTRYELLSTNSIEYELDYCKCRTVLEPFRGYYGISNRRFHTIEASKRLIARTAIMDSTQTAMPRSLYTLEALDEKKNRLPQQFIGELETDTAYEALRELLDQDDTVYIGSAKSRGLGRAKIELKKIGQRRSSSTLAEKFEKLNDFLEDLGRTFFSVSLCSDAILLDNILRYKSMLDTCDLVETIENIPDQPTRETANTFKQIIRSFKLQRAWTSSHLLTGWNMALKLPKEDELAITQGSVFLFSSDESVTDTQRDSLKETLPKIEEAGVGERRNEGFGRVSICDEFHLKKGSR